MFRRIRLLPRGIFEFRISSFEFPTRAAGLILFTLAVLVMMLAHPAVASAQGCAMCYTAAAAAKATAIRALRSGILILLFPPSLIFLSILGVAYRRRNSFNEPEASAEDREIREAIERLEPMEVLAGGKAGSRGISRSGPGN